MGQDRVNNKKRKRNKKQRPISRMKWIDDINNKGIINFDKDSNMVANSHFLKGMLKVAYHGLNRNKIEIPKEVFEKAIPSIYNVPVVAYINGDDFGGHEKIECDDGSSISITTPIGIVPETANWEWRVEDDKEYLYVDVLIWDRQKEYCDIITAKNGVVAHSMEIDIKDGEYIDDGVIHVDEFEFYGFCLLGDDNEPCYENSKFIAFTLNNRADEYQNMYNDYNIYKCKRGDMEDMEDFIKKLCEKYDVDIDSIDKDFTDMSKDEIEKYFEEMYGGEIQEAQDEDEEVNDDNDGDNGESKKSGVLNSYLVDILYELIHQREIKVCKDNGFEYTVARYYMRDYDAIGSIVYYLDNEKNCVYGAKFKVVNDDVIIDFDTAVRKICKYVDYIDSNNNIVSATLSNKYEELNKEVSKLKQFKVEAEKKERSEAEAVLFENFDNIIHDKEKYNAIKAVSAKFTLDELEKELLFLVGQEIVNNANKSREVNGVNASSLDDSANKKAKIKINVDSDEKYYNAERYGNYIVIK